MHALRAGRGGGGNASNGAAAAQRRHSDVLPPSIITRPAPNVHYDCAGLCAALHADRTYHVGALHICCRLALQTSASARQQVNAGLVPALASLCLRFDRPRLRVAEGARAGRSGARCRRFREEGEARPGRGPVSLERCSAHGGSSCPFAAFLPAACAVCLGCRSAMRAARPARPAQ